MKYLEIKVLLTVILVITYFMSISSCYYDVETDVYPNMMCDTIMVSYAQTVAPILSASCLPCHNAASNDGGYTLDNYDDVFDAVQFGRIIGAIRRDSGFSPMPRNEAKLTDCNIDRITGWINQGALNN